MQLESYFQTSKVVQLECTCLVYRSNIILFDRNMILSIQFVQEIALALNLFCPFEVKKRTRQNIYCLFLYFAEREFYFISEKWLAVEEEDGKVEREFLALDGNLGFKRVNIYQQIIFSIYCISSYLFSYMYDCLIIKFDFLYTSYPSIFNSCMTLGYPYVYFFINTCIDLTVGVSDHGDPIPGGLSPVVIALYLSLLQPVHADPETDLLPDPFLCLHVSEHTCVPLHL